MNGRRSQYLLNGDAARAGLLAEVGRRTGPKDMHRNPDTRALNSTTNHGPEPPSSDRPIPAAGHFRGLWCVSFGPDMDLPRFLKL